ncbi:MAG: Holliday junction branch migration protein RuvA [Christensenellaceae bacterium]|jgi:Holliday junction DNA helicase RuvA
MYAFFKGTLAEAGENYAVVACGGVGYQLFTTHRFLHSQTIGEEVTLYSYLVVREGEMSLYGFPLKEEKEMFERLIGISGIGPKVALSILSFLTYQEVAAAIFAADASVFSRVNGVGKKTAERIVLELKDKVDITKTLGSDTVAGLQASATTEAIDALLSLGYQRNEAVQAIKDVQALADTAEDLILLALKRLAP